MPAGWLRIVYVAEFLLAVMVTFTLWSQVGGQMHLDMIPWYWKLSLGAGLSLAVVRATMAAVEHEKSWNPRSLAWLAGSLGLALAMGLVTYYYHLLEPQEEEAPEDQVTTSRTRAQPGGTFHPGALLPGRPLGAWR